MADSDNPQQQQHQHSNSIVEVVEALAPGVSVIPDSQITQTEVEEVSEDLLQQALGVAVNTFQQEGVDYAAVDGVVSIVEQNDVGQVPGLVSNVVGTSTDDGVATLVEQVQNVDGGNFEASEYDVCIDESVSAEQIAELTNNAEELCESAMIISDHGEELGEPTEDSSKSQANAETQVFSLQTTQASLGNDIRVTLVPTNAQSGAPLGSSQNPIRIIQQGNQYTPVQHLSPEQLSQIMQVVQQQQLAKTTQEGGGSSTLFNPDTNTRIVYRVIYPSELHKSSISGTNTHIVTQTQGQQTAEFVQRRTYKKRRIEEEEEGRADAPELSREEKEERKKHRPRTRSGRVSKPPKHMVKDYKHIHPLDWDEDPYDDSDGGYSDYKYSEDERGEDNEDSNDTDFAAGLNSMRPKKWKCQTCEKSYIGRGGLSRHYRLNPDHGKESDLPAEVNQKEDTNERVGVTNGVGFSGHFSEDSSTQDSLTTISTNNSNGSAAAATTSNSDPTLVVKRSRGWPKGVPRNTAMFKSSSVKRKRKLREFLKVCTDEELMELVLPRLSKVITLWEFLLMKVEKGSPSRPHVGDVYQEFKSLHKKVQSMCQKYLKPSTGQQDIDQSNKLQIQDADVARSLGLEVGTYSVKTVENSDDSFPRKVETANSTTHEGQRLVDLVSNTGFGGKHIIINAPSNMANNQSGMPLIRVPLSSVGGGMAPPKPQVSSSVSLANGQKKGPDLIVQANKTSGNSSSTNQLLTVVSPGKSLGQSLLVPPQKLPTTNAQVSLVSSASKTSGNLMTNSLPVGSLQTAKSTAATVSLQSVPTVRVQSGGLASSHVTPPQSTQIKIPVMLPQGTEQISLELPSSLAETILHSNISSAAQTSSAVSGSGLTYTTTATNTHVNPSSLTVSPSPVSQQEAVSVQNVLSSLSRQTEEQQQIVTVQGLGEVQVSGEMDTTNVTQFVQHEGDVATLENGSEILTEDQLVEGQIITGSNIFQTEDGILIIQNPDGTTLQLQGAQNIPLETVQALLAMDGDSQGSQSEMEVAEFGNLQS